MPVLSTMGEPESDNESAGAAAAATGAAGNDPASRPSTESSLFMSSKEQERFLPIANVSRIMKKALPGNAKVSKEAKEAVQECVSEFISFITGEASDKCLRERRKTINGDDLLWGLATLGFDDYVEPLKSYLARYRETEGDRNNIATNSSGSSSGSRTQHDLLDLNAASIDLMQVAVGNSSLSSRYPLQQMYWVAQQQQQEN